MVRVKLRERESQQQLHQRFRKVVSNAGVLGAVKRKRWFVSRSEQRRLARKKAIRRQKNRAAKSRRGLK